MGTRLGNSFGTIVNPPARGSRTSARILLSVFAHCASVLLLTGASAFCPLLTGVALASGARTAIPIVYEPPLVRDSAPGVFGVSQAPADTFFYGGTVAGPGGVLFAAEPSSPGWANRKMWTWSPNGFNGTPHSGLNMDGWVGADSSTGAGDWFRVQDVSSIGSCVIAGNKSLFCGLTGAECAATCYKDASGTGYGNMWRQAVATASYTYSASNQVSLSYKYSNESEQGWDSTYVKLQVYSVLMSRWQDYAVLASYTGAVSGSATIDVDSYLGSAGSPVMFRFVFRFVSDAISSDEDGLAPTTCGAFTLDSYSVTGSVTDSEDFESVAVGSLPASWSRVVEPGCGDFAMVKHLNNLSIPITTPPCGPLSDLLCSMQDSVLVLYDDGSPAYPHPLCQYSYAFSPVIDFSAHPDLPGRFFYWERFAELPLTDNVFVFWQVRHKPGCASGSWSIWTNDDYVYYTPGGAGCQSVGMDVSSYVPPDAQQVQVGLGVVNFCDEDPWGLGCSHSCNVTPYYDNVTFGVFGSVVAPYISMREIDYWQDQFAEDGTLNPSSTADTRVATDLITEIAVPPIFGDTLVCRATADNAEVYFVFRMAKVGPWQSTSHSLFTTWFPGVTGGGWREARMDTAEVTSGSGTFTMPVLGQWMCTFHEQDPVRIANGLAEGKEILPNNLFVPGTRIEYFLKARYAGSSDWFLWPDTTGGNWEEFEILPMMRIEHGSARWPCLIVADHFGQRGNSGERNADRIARHLRANNFDFDIFTKLGPTSNLKNGLARWSANPGQIGGPGTDKYNWGPGATYWQMIGYTHCILNTGNVIWCVDDADAVLLRDWMSSQCSSPGDPRIRAPAKFLWVSGDQVCRTLSNALGNRRQLLNSYLCATYTSANKSYSQKSGDNTYCLPMNGVAGGRLSCPEPELFYLRENACPGWYNVLGLSTASGCSGLAEVEYNSAFDGTTDIAAITNEVFGSDRLLYLTLLEGYDFCQVRTDASLGPLACGSDDFLTQWMGCVLSWANYPHYGDCPIGCYVGVGEPRAGISAVTSLWKAFPNPANPEATIRYTVGKSGRVTLKVFDVAGRVVRTLVDAEQTARPEPYDAVWDGRNDSGERAPSGVYFYQLETRDYRSAKKIVIIL